MTAVVKALDGSIGFLVSTDGGTSTVNWINGDNDRQILTALLSVVPCTGSDEDALS